MTTAPWINIAASYWWVRTLDTLAVILRLLFIGVVLGAGILVALYATVL